MAENITPDLLLEIINEAEYTEQKKLDLHSSGITEVPATIGNLINLQELDLGGNRLTEIPATIGNLINLQELDLGGNRLTEIPATIGNLINLQDLDLGDNRLTEIPATIGNLINLQDLDLGDNRLTEIPATIGNLINLQKLALRGPSGWWRSLLLGFRLREVPATIGNLINLQDLDLGDNRLTEIPATIGNLTNLQKLALRGNRLREIPATIGNLTNLQDLDLRGNGLTEIPATIGNLTDLQKLDLGGGGFLNPSSNNRLTEIPAIIGNLINLQELDLGGNGLTEIPATIGNLTDLRELALSNNHLTEVPAIIGNLTNLQKLALRGNRLTEVPAIIGNLTDLRELALSNNHLTEIPATIGNLTDLRELALSNNHLTEIPATIGNLTDLRELALSNNRLTEVPAIIGNLTNLQDLDLGGNGLTEIPATIGNLINLQDLDLRGNRLTEVPAIIGNLTNLQKLALRGNRLTEVPAIIGNLTNLQDLDLGGNGLTEIPATIGNLINLQDLDLGGNHLTKVPAMLGQLEKLGKLDLEGNPLNPVLQSAYDVGLNELRSYLHSLEENAESLYEAKLVFIGEGNVGKTTLLKALTGQEPQKNEKTTHGVSIDIQALNLPHPDINHTIQFNCWDFGGQEVYRATHQFFFSKRAIYLLVWEPRRGVQQCQVEEWLKIIRLRVGYAARVIIVSTHAKTGERIARIDEPVFKRDFGEMIVAFHEVDSLVEDKATGDKVGVAELKRLIAAAAKDLDIMGMPLSQYWVKARNELLDVGKTQARLSYQEFAAICAQHTLTPVAIRTLAAIMHDLGYIIYYGDDERLKEDVVLQPEWLTKAIGFILEDRTTAEMAGILPDNRLRAVWLHHNFQNEPRYEPHLYPFFLRLMEKYDVSYRLESGDASLVAQHVPQVRPLLPWLPEEKPAPGQRRIAMVCAMADNPPGLIPWMIVRTHDYTFQSTNADGKGQRLHWQKGMFLQYKGHGEAMLELQGHEFHIYTQAVYPEYFMNVLRQTLYKLIIDNWPGMQGHYTFTVPCREQYDGAPCIGRFDIDALSQFLNEGDHTIRCQVCRTRQEIQELLFGFEIEDSLEQLTRIETKLDEGFAEVREGISELESRVANTFWALMRAIATEAKDGPRLYTIRPSDEFSLKQLFNRRYELQLWCEVDGGQHRVLDTGKGVYEFNVTRDWLNKVTPYLNFSIRLLKTLVPIVTPAIDSYFGADTTKNLGVADELKLADQVVKTMLEDINVAHGPEVRAGALSEVEHSGLLILHSFLKEKDPNYARLGLHRMPTYTGDFRWLCRYHYEQAQPKIPDRIE